MNNVFAQAQVLISQGILVTQISIEVLDLNTNANALVTQIAVEVLDTSGTSNALVTQISVEALVQNLPMQFGQAQAKINAFDVPQFAQALTQLNVTGRQRFGQALAVIQPINGLVGAYWTGGAYNVSNTTLTGWWNESSRGKPNYGNGIANYPGQVQTDNQGIYLAGHFTADETGAWQFATSTDDGSLIYIISGDPNWNPTVTGNFSAATPYAGGQIATMNNNWGGGQAETLRSGTVTLTAGKDYTIIFLAGQGSGGWVFRGYYARPGGSSWVFLTDGHPPWIFYETTTYNQVANVNAKIKAFGVNKSAQAAAWIGTFKTAHTQADIKQTYQTYAQANAWVIPPTKVANAQADILQTYPIPNTSAGSVIIYPDSDVVKSGGIEYTSGTTGWNLVDEVVTDTSDWYHVYDDFGYIIHGFTSPNIEGDYKVTSVVFNVYVSNGAPAEAGHFKVRNPDTGSLYDVLQIGQNGGPTGSVTLTTRPWDSQPWTPSDIENIQFGDVPSGGVGGFESMRVYQINATVNYYFMAPVGQAQAKIISVVRQTAQAQAVIRTTTQFANTQADILATYFVTAQALATLKATESRFAQANTDILQTSQVFAQAGAQIRKATHAITLSWIKQTYPLVDVTTDYAASGTASASFTYLGSPAYTLDEIFNTYWACNVAIGNDAWLEVDLGQVRTINSYYIQSALAASTFKLQYSTDNSSWTDVTTLTFPSTDGYVLGTFNDISARYWRVLATVGGNYNGIDVIGITKIKLGTYTVIGSFAQSQALLGHLVIAQALAKVSPGRGIAFGQAHAKIIKTYQTYAQVNAWIIPTTQIANAQADIVQKYTTFAQVNAWIIPPTVVANVLADIFGITTNTAQAQADIKVTSQRVANTQAQITKSAGYSIVNADIKQDYFKFARVQALIGSRQSWAQAEAFIQIFGGFGYANTQTSIKATRQAVGNAMAFINRGQQFGQANVSLLQTYTVSAQALALYAQWFRLAQAASWVKDTYRGYASAQAKIKQTYQPVAQAQSMIEIVYPKNAQAQGFIVHVTRGYAQALTQVGAFKYAQAQARVIAFGVPRTANANGYIRAREDIVYDTPSSDRANYLVRFNDFTLPGYAQTEQFDSNVRLNISRAAYRDNSLVDYLGLENKPITIKMRVWEPTYNEAKLKVQEAVTYLRSVRKGFRKLYIGYSNKYYLALVKSIIINKSVGESAQILDYDITFEAKPWLISNETYSISGTGTLSTGARALTLGGWTPAHITVSGTDVTITGITEYGQDVGSVSISGTVSDYVIDTEAFSCSDTTLITPKDFAVYIGVGETTFTITGATSCVITWQNRWYL